MDIFGQVAAKRKEIEEATKMNIAKSFQENLNPEIKEKKIEKSFDNELNEVYGELFGDVFEKAVYADTPQNRKLGRVGQEYHRGKGKKEDKSSEKNKWGKKIASEAYQKQSYNTISKKLSKYLNGEDDSMEFVDSYWRSVNNGADEKRLQDGIKHAIHNLVSPESKDAKDTFNKVMSDIKTAENDAKKEYYTKN